MILNTMQILNIAGYKFVALNDVAELRALWQSQCDALALKGTILVSPEGINLSLAGNVEHIELFKRYLQQDVRFADMTYRESYSDFQPFKHMKIKIKKEIITMRRPKVRPEETRAPSVSPQELKQWLDEGRDITLLDTRNDYEVQFGTFRHAINMHIQEFCEFPQAAEKITRDKPIVMFCTGGIRCEKAALHLLNEGFSHVYQLQGGILNYFAEVGESHYEGECFVFDQRVAVDANLKITGTKQCVLCQGPIKSTNLSCSTCVSI